MCTVTWWCSELGYELFFSRDELKSRKPGLPPELFVMSGVKCLGPRDGDAGGTWISTNEFGLTVCVLNQYPSILQAPGCHFESRGHLVRKLSGRTSIKAVLAYLESPNVDLFAYQPFRLVFLERGHPGVSVKWDGKALDRIDEASRFLPFTSSSFLSDEIVGAREREYANWIAEHGDLLPEDLRRFHESHSEEAAAHSVCMQRPDAETVSLVHLVVREDEIAMHYAPKVAGEPRFLESQVSRLQSKVAFA